MRGSAPGRLDLLGGVADYSGALVLEMPTRQRPSRSRRGPTTRSSSGPAALLGDRGASAWPSSPTRTSAARWPRGRRGRTTSIGVALVLVRHGVIDPPAGAARDLLGPAPVGGRGVERGARGGDRPGPRGRWPRPAPPGRPVPGGGEPCRGRTLRDHGSGRGDAGDAGRGAADPVPAGLGGAGGARAARARDRRLAHRRAARRRRRAVRAGARRRLHGEAHGRGGNRVHVVLGERAAAGRGRRAARRARRRRLPGALGRDRRRRDVGRGG